MKKLILAIGIILISTALQAQSKVPSKKTIISIAANARIPTNSFFSLVAGIDIQADFGINQILKITASAGYEDYWAKKNLGGGNSYIIPLLAGAKFTLGSDKVYGHAQLGYGFFQDGGGALGYAASIGYYFSPNFDGSIKYLAFTDVGIGSIGVRLAYNF